MWNPTTVRILAGQLTAGELRVYCALCELSEGLSNAFELQRGALETFTGMKADYTRHTLARLAELGLIERYTRPRRPPIIVVREPPGAVQHAQPRSESLGDVIGIAAKHVLAAWAHCWTQQYGVTPRITDDMRSHAMKLAEKHAGLGPDRLTALVERGFDTLDTPTLAAIAASYED